MPPRLPKFNPAYSTIRFIRLTDGTVIASGARNPFLRINTLNDECRFERLEMVESVNEILPSGSIVVTDLKDIISYIGLKKITTVEIEFFDGSKMYGDITSVSYIDNAASDADTTTVAINFSNSYYKYFSSNSLIDLLGYKSPQVFSINELASLLRLHVFGSGTNPLNAGFQDFASNFFLYRPSIPYMDGDETQPTNALEFFNYLATGAVDETEEPNFIFWTTFGGGVHFKSFKRDLTKDSSYPTINADYRNIAVYDGDAVIRKLSDGKYYRKAYMAATNPAYQWISKNYYYIRKTPKYLDELAEIAIDPTLTGTAYTDAVDAAAVSQSNQAIKNLMFHFQDNGQKYNIDVVSITGRGAEAPKGGDHIPYEKSWGYFDSQIPSNSLSITNLLGNQYAVDKNYALLNLMGHTQYMPFLDSPDMWKNMFDLTPIHPHYPDNKTLPITSTSVGITGSETNLQKVMDIRYEAHKEIVNELEGERVKKLRQIEMQNFIAYSLCCLQKENCFFATLTRYEPDNVYYGTSGASGASGISAPSLPLGAKFYRYKWNKINFDNTSSGPTGSSGSSGGSGGSGGSGSSGSYEVHQLERWALDQYIKSSDSQDQTWAINLNERGLSSGYLPPGWVSSTTGNFKYRPIGATASASFPESANINHIVRLCVEQIDANKQLVYFWAENIVDGTC